MNGHPIPYQTPRWSLWGYNPNQLDRFTAVTTELRFLLDEIQTDLDFDDRPVAVSAFVEKWSGGLVGPYEGLLRKICIENEFDELAEVALHIGAKGLDFDWEQSDPEIPRIRAALAGWSNLVTLYRSIERKLRPAVHVVCSTPAGLSEELVQDVLECLFIGCDIPYDREVTIGAHRADFAIRTPRSAIEVKLCGPNTVIHKLKDDIRAHMMKYSAHYQRIFFVIYDCCRIQDHEKFEEELQSHKLPVSTIVRVIPH